MLSQASHTLGAAAPKCDIRRCITLIIRIINDDDRHHCDDIYKCNAPTGDAGAQKFDLHCCIVFMVTVMMVMMMVMIIIIMCGCLTLSAGAPECDSRRCIAWLFTSPFVYSHLHLPIHILTSAFCEGGGQNQYQC